VSIDLRRTGGSATGLCPCLPSATPWHGRVKIGLSFSSAGLTTSATRKGSLGMCRRTHTLLNRAGNLRLTFRAKESPWLTTLQGKRIAILATDGVERVELECPRKALHDAGAETELLSLKTGEIRARNNDLESAGTFTVDRVVGDASVSDYDALLLPGGTVNPDKLRVDETAVSFVGALVATGKLVAAICHGPWTLVEADVVEGRTLTSFPSLRTDLRNAGATVVDEEVVIDGNLTTSRSPSDLPAFCAAIVEQFAQSPVAASGR
jgi:protease I